MKSSSLIANLSPQLFWDADNKDLDEKKSKSFIIQRVIEYGGVNDWKIIRDFYGIDEIRQTVLELPALDDISISFLCTVLNLKEENFRCYTRRQLNPHFWTY